MMVQLSVKLPPFSPDYSGVCSALFELGGLIVIHDASGCTGNYTGYDEPRFYGSKSLVYCSGLRELDAVMGNDEKFIRRICAAAADLKPEFICFLGSPVPMIIGTDLTGIAKEIEAVTGIPSFGFNTTGLNYYNKGLGDGWSAFVKRFLVPEGRPEPVENGINVLGLSPLDWSVNSNAEKLINILKEMGFQVVSKFAMNSSFEEVRRAGTARVNVVVAESGMQPARLLYESLGIPYVVGLPLGNFCRDNLEALIREAMKDGKNRILEEADEGEKRILILHEEVLARGLKTCLNRDYGVKGIQTASCFGRNLIPYQEQTLVLNSEREIADLLNQGGFDVVMADPLMKDLLHTGSVRWIDLPHVAISSKIHWDNYCNFFQMDFAKMKELFK